MAGVLAVIPYTTFPEIELGPLRLRTFGLMVGIGVLLGAWLAARWAERFGVDREDTYRLATRMVVGGVIGSRITWDLSHLDQIHSPVDLIAIWKGGLQFSGGFAAGVVVGYPAYQKIPFRERWHALDGYAYGLTIGLAFGRIGCISVGEHFGRISDFFLAVRYDGGSTRETSIGSQPLVKGMTFHNAAIYELLYLLVLFALMTALRRRAVERPGTLIGTFCVCYGVLRFLSDSLRANDERVLHLTGAQYLMIATTAAGIWILVRVRRLVAATPPDPAAVAAAAGITPTVPDEVEAPDSEVA
jgi:phosphatidylglycerol:prolipoprotein diacylglycerol transferase